MTDIMVNGCDQVFVEKHGKLHETGIHFHDDKHLMLIIDRIVSQVGRRVDESSPMVDARLRDGSVSTRSFRRSRSTVLRFRSGVSARGAI
jgi:pilus assembly protein CpaF